MESLRGEIARVLDVAPSVAVAGGPRFTAAWDVDGVAGAAVAGFADALTALTGSAASVDSGAVATWFRQALSPVGWSLRSPWDAVAGDYRSRDGWIRLHTNAPRHRDAALRVLGVPADRGAVAEAAAGWTGDDLETAVVEAGGAAAVMRSATAWERHPQGRAVRAEPLIARSATDAAALRARRVDPARPLDGVRVLDLTRVIAGPVAGRALAAYGAEVLRIDPPGWEEPALEPDMTLGKRTARLDARGPEGRERLLGLLAQADVLLHGYRLDALDGLGLGEDVRRRVRPGLIEVALTAYGWTGPWAARRGFDSLVQMSAGIAERGSAAAGRPVPLPVQALDHATGWLMAAAAVAGLRDRLRDGHGSSWRLSLARTAAALTPLDPRSEAGPPAQPGGERLATPWGSALLVHPPFQVHGVRFAFGRGPSPLGSATPAFLPR